MIRLRWKAIAPGGERYHVARVTLPEPPPVGMHDHDFAEIFWVERGEGTHLINGRSLPLGAGDLWVIRARDRHTFRAGRRSGLALVNFAVPAATLAHLRRRYFPRLAEWFWREGPMPFAVRARSDLTAWLEVAAERLLGSTRDALPADLFLLGLFDRLGHSASEKGRPEMPGWLGRACAGILRKEHFEKGVAGFFALAGRCPEHVARMTRHHTGQTPSALVNRARMDYAARRLESADVSVTELALECGLNNLSHFHRLFRERFGLSPLRYRKLRGQRLV